MNPLPYKYREQLSIDDHEFKIIDDGTTLSIHVGPIFLEEEGDKAVCTGIWLNICADPCSILEREELEIVFTEDTWKKLKKHVDMRLTKWKEYNG